MTCANAHTFHNQTIPCSKHVPEQTNSELPSWLLYWFHCNASSTLESPLWSTEREDTMDQSVFHVLLTTQHTLFMTINQSSWFLLKFLHSLLFQYLQTYQSNTHLLVGTYIQNMFLFSFFSQFLPADELFTIHRFCFLIYCIAFLMLI